MPHALLDAVAAHAAISVAKRARDTRKSDAPASH